MYLDDEITKRIENRVDRFVVCFNLNQIHNIPKRNEVCEKNIEKSQAQLHTND